MYVRVLPGVEACIVKLPIRRVPKTTPPQFEYYQTVSMPQGGNTSVKYVGCVPSSLESALCDLLAIAEQLAKDNEKLRRERVTV